MKSGDAYHLMPFGNQVREFSVHAYDFRQQYSHLDDFVPPRVPPRTYR